MLHTLPVFLGHGIQNDCSGDQDAFHDQLVLRGQMEQVQDVIDQAHDDRTDQRPGHRSDSAEKTAVENHSADCVNYCVAELIKPKRADILKRLDDDVEVGKTVDYMRSDKYTRADWEQNKQEIVDITAVAFNHISADEDAGKCAQNHHDAVGADLPAEDVKRR